MPRRLLALGFVWILACRTTQVVVEPGTCDPGTTTDCYTGPPGTRDKGSCHSGTRHCTPDGGLSACEGEITPLPEVCNSEDDDCNGLVDDDVFIDAAILGYCNSPACTGDAALAPFTCWGPDPGICGVGVLSACHHGGPPAGCEELVHIGAPEVCNGVDDDCNGLIDDGLEDEGPCTVTGGALGECVHGRLACVDYQCDLHGCADAADWCFPSLPAPEVCDGLDNDCNGVIDDGCDAGQ